MSFLGLIRYLDFYPKTQEDAIQRTTGGALATFISCVLLVYLMFTETLDFLEPKTKEFIDVDNSPLSERMRIDFDISFPRLPCPSVHADAVDLEGTESMSDIRKTVEHLRLVNEGRDQVDLPEEYCGNCYSLLKPDDRQEASEVLQAGLSGLYSTADLQGMAKGCCDSCDILRLLWARRHGPQSLFAHEDAEQCMEGCRLLGHFEVPRRKGNFHFAAGASMDQKHGGDHSHHQHRLTVKDMQRFNTSHFIHELKFGGGFPNKIEPLDGERVIEQDKLAQYVYYINVVPTTWMSTARGELHRSHQFSYYKMRKEIRLESGHFPLPGIFFKFDIDAIHIAIHHDFTPFTSFIVRITGILGGFWVCLGLTGNLLDFLNLVRDRQNFVLKK